MNLENQAQVLLPVLIAGFAVILIVLITLICIVRSYGSKISEVSKNIHSENPKKFGSAVAPAAQNGIPEEVVAAIAAAVYTLYGTAGHTITSIKRAERPARSVWATAGLLENTRPF